MSNKPNEHDSKEDFEPREWLPEDYDDPLHSHFKDELHMMRGEVPDDILDDPAYQYLFQKLFMSGALASLCTLQFGIKDSEGESFVSYSLTEILLEAETFLGLNEGDDEEDEDEISESTKNIITGALGGKGRH